MKRLIRNLINRLGFDIIRKSKIDLKTVYGDFPNESLLKKRFYNIGAGKFKHVYWTNVDNATDYYSDAQKTTPFLQYDLMVLAPLPIESNVAELVYSSHTVARKRRSCAQHA